MASEAARTPKRPSELGAVGRQVAENLAMLRHGAGMKQQELSERLEAIGRPVPATSISKAEKGERRVDVDDLVALAMALDTSPNRLLLPVDERDAIIDLAPNVQVSQAYAWQWATGEWPAGPDVRDRPFSAFQNFRWRALPSWLQQTNEHRAMQAATDVRNRLYEVVQGHSFVLPDLRRALARLLAEIDEVEAQAAKPATKDEASDGDR
jgi:transcriptional regulator with XRE-family HTH domain